MHPAPSIFIACRVLLIVATFCFFADAYDSYMLGEQFRPVLMVDLAFYSLILFFSFVVPTQRTENWIYIALVILLVALGLLTVLYLFLGITLAWLAVIIAVFLVAILFSQLFGRR